jgi:hypothetical protein
MIRRKYVVPTGEFKRDYYEFKKVFSPNDIILPFEFQEASEDEEVLEWQESKSL